MALRLPPMQALRAFEAAARELSLTRAANSLNLTHGAISHQIKALESDLGVRLVARAGRGIRLTDEGERFAQRVRGALTELSDAVRELADRSNPRQLRISVTPSFAARWLLPRMARFAAAHPDIDLDVRARAPTWISSATTRIWRSVTDWAAGTASSPSRCSPSSIFPSAARGSRTAGCQGNRPTSRATRCCVRTTSSGSHGSPRQGCRGPNPIAGRSSTTPRT